MAPGSFLEPLHYTLERCHPACQGPAVIGTVPVFLDTAYWAPACAVEAVFFASSRRLASYSCLLTRCLSRHTSHLIWPGMALLEQLRHWPFSFLSCRTCLAFSLAVSFRFCSCALACSYTRRASSCSSGVLLGFGAFWSFGFLGCGFLALLGLDLGFGLVSSKVCWKVILLEHGWGPGVRALTRTFPSSQPGFNPLFIFLTQT